MSGQEIDESIWQSRPNAWLIAHSRFAAAIKSDHWDEAAEREWYAREFAPLIPRSCCRYNWGPIEAKLDWSSAEAAFRSWWQAHNEVSEKHSGKPTITYDECCRLYEVDLCANDSSRCK